jgi:hypothetical protein
MAIELVRTQALPRPWGLVDTRPWNKAGDGGVSIGNLVRTTRQARDGHFCISENTCCRTNRCDPVLLLADFVAKVADEIGVSPGDDYSNVEAARSCRSLQSERRL